MIETLKTGDPLDETTDVGPLIRPNEVERLERWIKDAEGGDGKIAIGGKKLEGNCFEPTLILDPSDKCKVSNTEVFGPILSAYSYQSIDEAISRANRLPFSFQAAIFTKNIDTALTGASRLKATTVLINEHTAFRVDWMPFGGEEQSGLKSGGIPYSMQSLVLEKMTVIKSKNI